jgi:hypothetical protein
MRSMNVYAAGIVTRAISAPVAPKRQESVILAGIVSDRE